MKKSRGNIPVHSRKLVVPNRVNAEQVRVDLEKVQAEKLAQEERDREEAEKPIDIERLPLQPLTWFLLVQPLAAPKKVGEFFMPDQFVAAQEYLTTVAEIIAMGPACFKGTTKSGVSLTSVDLKVGDWLIYPKHVGQELKLSTKQRVLIIQDTDVIAKVIDPRGIFIY